MKISFKSVFILLLQIIGLTVALYICHGIGSSLIGNNMDIPPIPIDMQSKVALAWLGICFLNSLALVYPISRSTWHGWKLMLAVAGIYFGISSLLSQIESLVFLKYLVHKMTVPTIKILLFQSALSTCLFAPLAVLIMGKIRKSNFAQVGRKLNMPWQEWFWKLGVIGVCYYIIYFSFGFLVAWQSPAVREYYAGMSAPLWLIPLLQMGRSLIWAGLAVIVIKMMKGAWWESGLAVALLYSILMSSVLLLPYNPIMPPAVAAVHFRETLSSNFIFGWLVVWVLNMGQKIPSAGSLAETNAN